VLAARAGVKAAGRSALAGGVILAAIEGLNILIMRVLMPKIEKQGQEASGMAAPVDPLLPPNDPSRPRSKIPKKPLWEKSASPSPLYQSSSSSSNTLPSYSTSSSSSESTFGSSSSQWDTPGFRSESTASSDRASIGEESKENKSSWKFW
jgi:hypothetical protein